MLESELLFSFSRSNAAEDFVSAFSFGAIMFNFGP